MMNGNNRVWAVGLSFLTGLVVGGAAGVLYAPQSGARTRRRLSTMADDVRERAGEVAEDAAGAVEKMVERGRRLVTL